MVKKNTEKKAAKVAEKIDEKVSEDNSKDNNFECDDRRGEFRRKISKAIKIIAGLLVMVVAVYLGWIFRHAVLEFLKGGIGILVLLIGLFIVFIGAIE